MYLFFLNWNNWELSKTLLNIFLRGKVWILGPDRLLATCCANRAFTLLWEDHPYTSFPQNSTRCVMSSAVLVAVIIFTCPVTVCRVDANTHGPTAALSFSSETAWTSQTSPSFPYGHWPIASPPFRSSWAKSVTNMSSVPPSAWIAFTLLHFFSSLNPFF